MVIVGERQMNGSLAGGLHRAQHRFDPLIRLNNLPPAAVTLLFQPVGSISDGIHIPKGVFWMVGERHTGVCHILSGDGHLTHRHLGRFRFYGVGQKTDCDQNADDSGCNHNPYCGLSEGKYSLDSLLHSHLCECHRTGGDEFPRQGAGKKHFGICLLLGSGHVLNHLFITGKFNIPAQQTIGNPDQRVKPMDAEQEKTNGLSPVIQPRNVGTLMGDNTADLLLR